MKLTKTKDGEIILEKQKLKSKDRKSFQWELNESTIKLWEKSKTTK